MRVKFVESDQAAQKVHAAVKRLGLVNIEDDECYVSPFRNGRERGLNLRTWLKTSRGDGIRLREVSFAEYRRTDDIVVYSGGDGDFDINGIPTDETYKKAHFFNPKMVREAGLFVAEFLSGQARRDH